MAGRERPSWVLAPSRQRLPAALVHHATSRQQQPSTGLPADGCWLPIDAASAADVDAPADRQPMRRLLGAAMPIIDSGRSTSGTY